MRREVSVDIDPNTLVDAIGPSTFDRGVTYARQGYVERALWSASAGAILGSVRGSGANIYTTTARFSSVAGTRVFSHGECSCPVGRDCKHVVALVLVAAGIEGPATAPKHPTGWEQSLGALLEPRQPEDAELAPLAIEVSLSPDRRLSGPRLQARVVRPGKRGGWVAGDLSWSALATPYLYGDHPPEQVQLLRELFALSGHNPTYNDYSYGQQKIIDLSAFESRRLWPMLAEARAISLPLVHHQRALGELEPICAAEVCIDVTTSRGGKLAVSPQLRVDREGVRPVPVAFIGSSGHGLVFTDGAEPGSGRLHLAQLAKSVPAQLQQLLLAGTTLSIPGTDRDRFRDEFYPQLRHTATVISSDDSFTPPVISDPTLHLTAVYGTGHHLELTWAWVYQLGSSTLRIPVDRPATRGVREWEAEQAIVDGLDAGLEPFGLASATAGRRVLVPQTRLTGIDTMRFSTEVLPLLSDLPGVVVETAGEQPDYREAGDSLRIAVSADEVAGERDWFDLGVTITVEGREVPFAEVFTALARDESHLLLDDGAFFSLQKPELQTLRRLIAEARAMQDEPAGPLKISRFQAGLWGELSQLGVVDRQAQAWRQQVDGLLSIGSLDPPQLPPGVRAQLRPYQADGFGWLTFLWRHGLGGILADDMGLGKTLQTLALISHAKQAGAELPPFLIVAPASVVSNWAAESARFTPELRVVPIGETLARRGQTLADAVDGADVVVTSYTLLRLDFDAYAGGQWSGLVLDEAQFAKNHQSKVYQCARRLPAPFKLAITGTPMENNLMELWSLLSITAPGLFPNPNRFKDYYARPIEKSGEPELLAQLRRRIKPLLKRRTKEQVATELPAKQEQVLEIELHQRHRTIYQRHLQRERQKVLGLLADVDRNRFTILRSLTLLRQLSLHPALVDPKHGSVPCAKIDALFEQLSDVVDGGHRALVFSQFTGFLALVRARLDAAGVEYCYLDGKTRKRAEVIQRFKDGAAPVFLISLKAGGFGLNLTEADYCFLLDPWWNPATEAQAVDRTHRIGQTRNVMVYRLISADTIEEKVTALKARKAELFSSVLEDGNAFGATLDAEDIRGLFE